MQLACVSHFHLVALRLNCNSLLVLFTLFAVWQHLSSALIQVAAAVVRQQQLLHDLQQRRQAMLPQTLREAQLHQTETSCRRTHQRLQELTAAAEEVQGCLQDALRVYRECCLVMEVGGCTLAWSR